MIHEPSRPSRLRLLVLAPFAPRLDAPHGGARILAQFLLEISRRHQVALLYLRASDEPPIDPVLLERLDLVQHVTRTWAGPSVFQKNLQILRLAVALLRGKPMWAADWESRSFAKLVRSVAQSWHPDLVQIEFHIMAQYISALKVCTAPRILVEHEPARLAGPFLQNGPQFLRKIAHRLDRSAWEKYEPAVIRQVQWVVAFTAKDQETLAGYGLSTPISRIPFGTNLSNRPLSPLGAEPPSLLFVGNFIHPPNREAAIRLVRDIFPAVRRKYPHVDCIIVGPNPSTELRKLAGQGVTITGWVPEVDPYLDQASLFVAPVHIGGGLRVKILEAMAAGKAIVATPLAVEGLSVQNGKEVLLAEDDTEMLAQIDRLLANPAERAALSENAWAWASTNLSWEKTILEYERLYQQVLCGRKS